MAHCLAFGLRNGVVREKEQTNILLSGEVMKHHAYVL